MSSERISENFIIKPRICDKTQFKLNIEKYIPSSTDYMDRLGSKQTRGTPDQIYLKHFIAGD